MYLFSYFRTICMHYETYYCLLIRRDDSDAIGLGVFLDRLALPPKAGETIVLTLHYGQLDPDWDTTMARHPQNRVDDHDVVHLVVVVVVVVVCVHFRIL
jgi:hypothetical protein